MTNLTKSDAEYLVRGFYLVILRRDPEPEALSHWIAQLEGGLAPGALLKIFLGSEEARGLGPPVPVAYPPGHFYSPIVDPAMIGAEFLRRASEPPPLTLPGIAVDLDAQTAMWHRMLPFLREIPFPDEPAEGFRYHFSNSNFSYGDGSILYAVLRLFEPRRLIEIGSGYSSACSLDTIDRYLSGRVRVTFIEPFADLLRNVLGAGTMREVDLHESQVQDVGLDVYADLAANDLLFIDSTHIMKTDSDVCHELFAILPKLKSGVLIHFHDIFWPFEYGNEWVLKENRSWNEIYGMRAFLMYNDAFEILFFNDYFRRFNHSLIAATYPKFLQNTGGSLWLRKL